MTRRRWVLIALYLTLVAGGLLAGAWVGEATVVELRPSNELQIHAFIMAATSTYVLASAVPFVPGAEIGLGLILALGARIVPLIYLSTVTALTLAYVVGRMVPARATAAAFGWLGLNRARQLVLQIAPLDTSQRVALLVERAPQRLIPLLLRHRYIALALAFNLPGNSLIGGGGGIALAAGMSRLFPVLPYLLTVGLAVAPVPGAILLANALS